MNKYLITAALASALALTACGKKEEAAQETMSEEVKPAENMEEGADRAEKSMEKMGEWGDMKKDDAAEAPKAEEAPAAEEPKAEEKPAEEEKKAEAATPEEARQLAENSISQNPETETKQQ